MEKKLSLVFTLYFLFGIIFAFAFALYYRWPPLGYLSPGFYVVTFTWPYQAIGFTKDLLYYGLAGKPI
ncbi:hypothetical protein HYW46_07030 [Candidatus Daviesbacteria bacterium]|nr:hypothetical protein [Candidatus Daviesbacteria bacterium]